MAKLPLYTVRMLHLMDYVVENNINGCITPYDFLLTIEYVHTGNLSNLRSGAQKFRLDHYQNAIKVYGVDANFFFVSSCTDMGLKVKRKSPTGLQKLKEAVKMIELEQQRSSQFRVKTVSGEMKV